MRLYVFSTPFLRRTGEMAAADTAAFEATFVGISLEAAVSFKADTERVLGHIEDLKRVVLRLFQQSSTCIN